MNTKYGFCMEFQRIVLGTGLLVVVLVPAVRIFGEEAAPAASVAGQDEARVAFAAACLQLAEAELAEAEDLNRQVKNSVSDFEVERLKKCVALAQNNYSYAEQGVDYSQSIAEYVRARAELAELDLRMAEEIRARSPANMSAAQIERMRRYAAMCRLRVALGETPVSTMSIIEHLHWETHRLSEEVLQLNRRLERLEKKTTLR